MSILYLSPEWHEQKGHKIEKYGRKRLYNGEDSWMVDERGERFIPKVQWKCNCDLPIVCIEPYKDAWKDHQT